MKMVKVDMVAVGRDKGVGAFVVLLQGGGERRALPIFTGPFEVGAIALALEHVQPPRPLVHDLLKSVIDGVDAKVHQVEIVGMKQDYYVACVELTLRTGRHIRIDARPSDAIALALKSSAPIFVAEEIMDRSGVLVENGQALLRSPPEIRVLEELDEPVQPPKPKERLEPENLQARLDWLVREEAYEAAAEVRDLIQKESSLEHFA